MSGTDDLVAFVRQQLDEDERVVTASKAEPWGFYSDGHGPATWEFLNRFDEDRVLAEVEAKRRILALYDDACDRVRNPVSADARMAARVAQFELEQAIAALAQPYAGRGGWREEWQV